MTDSPGNKVGVLASTLIVGGAERQLQTLARGLRSAGWVCSFFLLKDAGAVGTALAREGFAVRTEVGRGPGPWLALWRELRAQDVLLALDHNNVLRLLGAFGPYLPPYVVVYHYQGAPRAAWRRALANAAAVVAVAASQRPFLAALGGRLRIAVIPNGVELPVLDEGARRRLRRYMRVPAGAALAIAVARLSPEKGVGLLVRALATLAPAARPRLVVAGDGPERAAVEALARELLRADDYDFRGEVEDVTPLYRAADLFVLPSYQESSPLALLEAMSFGVPAAAAAVGDVPALLAGGGGLTFEAGSAAECARAVRALAGDANARRTMGLRARATVEEGFTAATMVRRYEDLLSRVAGRR